MSAKLCKREVALRSILVLNCSIPLIMTTTPPMQGASAEGEDEGGQSDDGDDDVEELVAPLRKRGRPAASL